MCRFNEKRKKKKRREKKEEELFSSLKYPYVKKNVFIDMYFR